MSLNGTRHPQRSVVAIIFPVMTGLWVAQVIATAFVYRSNLRLRETLQAVEAAGYYPVPNQMIAETLNSIGPAFWGGLFYTLSIGTGLTLATWAAGVVWDRMMARRRSAGVAMLLGWIGVLVSVNIHGAALFPTLFCTLVPLATAWSTLRGRSTAEPLRLGAASVPVITLAPAGVAVSAVSSVMVSPAAAG